MYVCTSTYQGEPETPAVALIEAKRIERKRYMDRFQCTPHRSSAFLQYSMQINHHGSDSHAAREQKELYIHSTGKVSMCILVRPGRTNPSN